MLVDGLALGICGTDVEIIRGEYGFAPEGAERLVLGHESLGRVRECPDDSGLSPGDLVVGIVRRPDPVPCACCARGEWDFCRNGRYTERGIKELHGYGSERWRIEPEFAVRLDAGLEDVGVLLEPTSVVAKAWEQIERIGGRACFDARRVLVTGAGPIGLLAALLAAQRGYEVHVLDRVTEGPKPELVQRLGGTYHAGSGRRRRRGRHRDRGHRGGPARRRRHRRDRAQRHRLPHRRLLRRAHASTSTSAASTARWCSRTTSCSGP